MTQRLNAAKSDGDQVASKPLAAQQWLVVVVKLVDINISSRRGAAVGSCRSVPVRNLAEYSAAGLIT